MRIDRTSLEWWHSIRHCHEEVCAWLQKQAYGEEQAAKRIASLAQDTDLPFETRVVLDRISEDEAKHAAWIKHCLKRRGLLALDEHENRYWKEALKDVGTKDEIFAAAAHAEAMRLERIRVIAYDKTAPWDIYETFNGILKDEERHAAEFRKLASTEALEKMLPRHQEGLKALGLVL